MFVVYLLLHFNADKLRWLCVVPLVGIVFAVVGFLYYFKLKRFIGTDPVISFVGKY